MRRTNTWIFFLPLYDTSFCLYVLVFWTGNFCGIFRNFSGIFLLNFIKNTLGLGQFRILTGQMMEFLVYLSHDEESQSHDSHHMFFYVAFTVSLAQVSGQIGLLMEKVMWTDCTVLHSQR